jgi:hypothetical protein
LEISPILARLPEKVDMSERTLVLIQPRSAATPAPLRYYDPELQNSFCVELFDADRLQRARAKAKELNAAYLKGLSSLAPRLSKRTFALFADPREPMFDSDLLEFSFGDSIQYEAVRGRRRTLEMIVRAAFRSFDEKTLHLLTYKGVRALSVNVPEERWFAGGRSRIDSLLAHELTGEENDLMKHAFLFASGAAISITFERVRWHTKGNR